MASRFIDSFPSKIKFGKDISRVNVDLLRKNEKAVPRVGGAPREGDCYVACPVSFFGQNWQEFGGHSGTFY